LKINSPFLLQYYEKWKKLLEQQTEYSDSIRGEGEYYGLARTGPYSFKSCYVAFRDNTKWCATVLTKATIAVRRTVLSLSEVKYERREEDKQ
jgi:hypothetical protein